MNARENKMKINSKNSNKLLNNYKINILNENLYRLALMIQSFNYLQITFASPCQIRSWTIKRLSTSSLLGEVKNIHLSNRYKSDEIELIEDSLGLFSQQIFGPIKNWFCACKKYNGLENKFIIGKICHECNVEITSSRVRRYRTGYIELTSPILHNWYSDFLPKIIYNILSLTFYNEEENLRLKNIRKEINQKKSLLKKVNLTLDKKIEIKEEIKVLKDQLKNKIIFEESLIKDIIFLTVPKNFDENFIDFFDKVQEYFRKYFYFYSKKFGAEFFIDYLNQLNIDNLIVKIKKNKVSSLLLLYLRILHNFRATQTKLEWLFIKYLPVLPPGVRPFFAIDDKIQAASLNIFYEHILSINSKNFFHNQKISSNSIFYIQQLQYSLNRLFDNSQLPENLQIKTNNRPLISLTEGLKGKFGRFRYNLLGKRVNFSARSVIITGPTLSLYQCEIPYKIALTLFTPHLAYFLKNKFKSKFSNDLFYSEIDWIDLIFYKSFFLYKMLNNIVQNYTILLNRAPTLHRFGIQAFTPILTLNKSISLHPLVCTGFNADFDGDQMAIHLPLYKVTQVEGQLLLSPQVLTPANGEVILKPSQDIVIGCCYLTVFLKKNRNIFFKYFNSKQEINLAYYQKKIDIHTPILINLPLTKFLIIKSKNSLILLNSKLQMLDHKIEVIKFIKKLNYIYLFLDCGILMAKKNFNKKYRIISLLFKTTPGRLSLDNCFNILN